MHILHLSTIDSQGGAFNATYRLHRGLRRIGADSQMLAQHKRSDDAAVDGPTGRTGWLINTLRREINNAPVRRYPDRGPERFSPAWLPERRGSAISDRNPDVVNLHWVVNGFLRPETIGEIEASLVWTLHDTWPLTGGCHYMKSCTKYEDRCGTCPHLGSDEPEDLSRTTWQRKRDAWADREFTLVAPCHWLADCAEQSSLFSGATVEVIPNGLDIQKFRPRPSTGVLSELGLDPDRKLVCFGAKLQSHRKGIDLLFDALDRLQTPTEDVQVAVFGGFEAADAPPANRPVKYLGFLKQEVLLRLYSAADVMVVPSRQETFGQTASEALSSGTPVVAFDATGPQDIVDHKETGYLADPYDVNDLAAGIDWVLADSDRREQLGDRARTVAEECFSMATVAEQYRDLYERIV